MESIPLSLGGVPVVNVDLKKYSTAGIGCFANAVFPKNQSELIEVLTEVNLKSIPFVVIGNGSNVVFSDKKINGIVIFTEKLNGIMRFDCFIRAYSGTKLAKLVDFYAKNNLSGLERFVGIPALVGGAIIMNAGAFGKNIGENVLSVCVIENNKKRLLSANDCGFVYRNGSLPENSVVLYADFAYGESVFADSETKDFLRRRKLKQPQGKSFGSAFKNPVGNFAGALIDGAKLKGYRIGGAKISEKHANFIINDKNATAADVKSLIEYIKEKVYGLYGIVLEEEVRFIGEF